MRRVLVVVCAVVGLVVATGSQALAVPPTADSGPSVVTKVGTDAHLSGTASDPDGDAVEIRWLRSVISGGSLASCTFSGPTSFQPISAAGLAPTLNCTQAGEYLLQLVASDGTSSFDSVGASVTFTPNHAPVVDSGPSVSVPAGTDAQLNGSASDPDGDALEIRWLRSVVSGGNLASCSFSGPTAFEPLTAAGLAPTLNCTQPGEYLMQLLAGDGELPDDDIGALVTFTPPLDLTAAVCSVVTPPGGRPGIRVADPQSGVSTVRGFAVLNATFSPRSATYGTPVPSSDLQVSRTTAWLPGLGYVTHTNGAGKSGVCLVAISARGALTVSKTTLPLPFSLP